ncbi:MAG: peptidase M48 [Comamonadaceae bacterium]|nr:MAG: peptidase M48 [Comamonadaceae bacterium]
MALPPGAAHAQLPTLGDGSDMTVSAERRMGARIARELYRDPDYIDDPVIADYVQTIWQPLLAAARTRGELIADMDQRFAWEILLGRDRSVNAFALPGGYLGVHLGLIGIVANRDELASVLAHELSHVTQRHIARMTTQQSRMAPWMMGAMILGALVVGRNAEAGNALITGGQALAIQNQLNFSRDMEREADRIGFGVLTQAGFDQQGFVTMFDKLQQASRLNDTGSFPYLRTHPMTTERIADMQSRQPLGAKPVTAPPSVEHAMVAARARSLSVTAVDVLRSRVAESGAPGFAAQGTARQAAVLYAAALAQDRLRDFSAARDLVAKLTALTGSDPRAARLARLLAAEIALDAGEPARAAALVNGASADRPEVMLWSQARMRSGKPEDVAQRLQTWVAQNPRDASAWQLLSSAYAAQGLALRSIRAAAESQVAALDYQAAIDRFKAAQDLVRKGGAVDHIEASIIDTRAREVESLLREQALER